MRRYLIVAIAVFLSGAPATVWSQSAQEIIEKSIAMDMQRKQSVTNYTVEQSMFGRNMLLYYEKIEGVGPWGPDGIAYSSFRLVMPDEIAERQGNGAAMSPEQLKIYARGIEVIGGQIDGGSGDSGMTGSLAMFVRAAATSRENRDDAADALTDAQQMAYFAAVAELVGIESIDGRQAFHVRAKDLNYSQPAEDGQEFIVNTVSVWLDTQQYVTLKLRMDGVVLQNGQSRDMYIEKIDADYRAVGPMYESYRQTSRMGGILDPAQEAELANSQAQLAELDARLASLPDDQRAMLEGIMGPQIKMLRNMVNGGGIEVETTVSEILVNPGLPDATEMSIKFFQMPAPGSSAVTPSNSVTAPGNSVAGPGVPGSRAQPDEPALTEMDSAALQAARQSRGGRNSARDQFRRRFY